MTFLSPSACFAYILGNAGAFLCVSVFLCVENYSKWKGQSSSIQTPELLLNLLSLKPCRQMKDRETEGVSESDKRSVGHEEEYVTSETCFSTRPSVHSIQTGWSLARLQLLLFSLQVLKTQTVRHKRIHWNRKVIVIVETSRNQLWFLSKLAVLRPPMWMV